MPIEGDEIRLCSFPGSICFEQGMKNDTVSDSCNEGCQEDCEGVSFQHAVSSRDLQLEWCVRVDATDVQCRVLRNIHH